MADVDDMLVVSRVKDNARDNGEVHQFYISASKMTPIGIWILQYTQVPAISEEYFPIKKVHPCGGFHVLF